MRAPTRIPSNSHISLEFYLYFTELHPLKVLPNLIGEIKSTDSTHVNNKKISTLLVEKLEFQLIELKL